MRPTWIIQTNIDNSETNRWLQALRDEGSKFRKIKIVPFSDDLPDLIPPADGPTVCYGTTTLIKNAPKKGYGVFFDPENFRPSLWCHAYGRHFVNWCPDGLQHLKDVRIPEGKKMFMRPDGDLKDFSGSIVDTDGLEKFQSSVSFGGYPFTDELPVFVSPVRDIVEEYRCFIVGGKVVSASKYMVRTMMDKKPGAPDDVLRFAYKMDDIWSPEKAYVLDICRVVEGSLHVLELNCFNASGVYACDIKEIVRAVEKLYEGD